MEKGQNSGYKRENPLQFTKTCVIVDMMITCY